MGGLVINDVPGFRVDHAPYGGVKESGQGREGVRYAIEEMTELNCSCSATPEANTLIGTASVALITEAPRTEASILLPTRAASRFVELTRLLLLVPIWSLHPDWSSQQLFMGMADDSDGVLLSA